MAAVAGSRAAAGLAGGPTQTWWRPTTAAAATSSTGSRRRRAVAVARAARHLRGAVALDGLDQQQERQQAARVHGAARRGRGRRRERDASGCGTWPSGSTPTIPVVPAEEALPPPERAPAARAGHRPVARAPEYPGEPTDVGEVGEPAVVEGVRGQWRVDPASWASRSPGGRRCCPRSTGWSTTASGWRRSSSSTTSWRCTSRPPSDAGATSRCRSSRRPAGRKARRHRRPQGRGVPGRRDPPGRAVRGSRSAAGVRAEIDELARLAGIGGQAGRIVHQ